MGGAYTSFDTHMNVLVCLRRIGLETACMTWDLNYIFDARIKDYI